MGMQQADWTDIDLVAAGIVGTAADTMPSVAVLPDAEGIVEGRARQEGHSGILLVSAASSAGTRLTALSSGRRRWVPQLLVLTHSTQEIGVHVFQLS